jgi:hypothetical protein
MKLIWSLILAIFATAAFAAECETHQPCAPNQLCECTVPAYSFVERYYYFDFPKLDKGHVYQCHFSDLLDLAIAMLDRSTFPTGAIWQPQYGMHHFPLDLIVDTNSLTQDSGKMIISYFVPGSDMPTTVSGYCNTVS